jgi:hypothetical protein
VGEKTTPRAFPPWRQIGRDEKWLAPFDQAEYEFLKRYFDN